MAPVWFFLSFHFFSPVPFLLYQVFFLAPTPPQPTTSDDTAKLHWIPTLLFSFLNFVRKHESKNI